MTIPKTVIEIVDPMPNPDKVPLVKPREVRVNGVPVMVAKDGLSIEYDDHREPVKVTLEIMPDQLIFRRAEPYRTLSEQIDDKIAAHGGLRGLAERNNQ